ncbi:type II toxin-antitoxin system ParD family antitoxin [Bradyrhizobium sp.]|uniref:type II toxin-antitoxin system ParD family antitoxin n=1 Tax=Bradyrhizobium sp. TaxID=376 RepID=UPI001D1AAB08|nr:type II toxin-antitoxin system ParD family antitoxin [Bradyrhizobium sp.]MBI5323188.1 type II toxin-antitoxin system ParD family antitoxin [Bradyrhizobium sp.]
MNMNVSLTDELGEFVNAKVSSGRYTSASEVVREALRLMERHEQIEAAKLQWLREAYQTGLASGDAGELDLAAVKAEARKKLGKTK